MNRWHQTVRSGIGLFFLAVAATANPEGRLVRMYVEAEDGPGLLRYPYDNEAATGWYAREANCRGFGAPGRGYCAEIHETSLPDRRTLSQKLGEPLAPGTYRVFLRAVGSRSATDESVVRIALGKASVEYHWNICPIGFDWHPGVDITLTEAADAIAITAVRFGGNSSRALYEPMHHTIWIDTIYLTSDLTQKTPPDIQSERALRAGIAPASLPPRPTYQSDEVYMTPRPEGAVVADPIRLISFDGRKNLWPNSSFELGMNDGWAGTQPYCFTDKDLDPVNPFHGKYSLRVPAAPDPSQNVPGPEPAVRLTPGIYPFSRPYHLPEGGDLCLSVYVRGKQGTPVTAHLKKIPGPENFGDVNSLMQNIKPAISAKGTLTESWQRIQASAKLGPGWYYLSLECPAAFWMDAIQLEKGTVATAYAPRAEVEAAIRTGLLANIVYDNQKTLTTWFHNSGTKKASAQVHYRIVDVRERVVGESSTPAVSVEPGQTVHAEASMLPSLRGVFSLTYAVEGRPLPEGETVFTILPEPSKQPTRHELGVNTTLHPVDLAIHSRLGIKWVLDCKTLEVGSANMVHPKPDAWVWRDERVARPRQYGMQLHPGFWPDNLPDFMTQAITQPERPVKNVGPRKVMPNLELWKDYVANVASHYKALITNWNIDDEVELHWDPTILASLLNVTLDSLHARAPEVRAGVSATPEFTEELLRHVDAGKLGFFGCSAFDFQYWQSRYLKRLKDQYHKQWVSYGVGARSPARTMYHTLYTYKPIGWEAAWCARQMINMVLLQDLDVAGHYSGIWRNGGCHLPGDKPLVDYDGTPLAWGGTFATVGRLLAEAEPLDDLPLGDTGRRVYLFQLGKQLVAVTWATCTRDYDFHWKPARRELPGLQFDCPQNGVAVRDMYWNPDDRPAWHDGHLTIDLGEEPVFLVSQSLDREAFTKMLAAVRAPAIPVETTFAMAATPDGTPELEVQVRNQSGKDLKNVSLDMRWPPGKYPFSAAGEWILKEPFKAVGDVPSGQTRTVRLKTLLDGRQPLEDATIRGVLKSGDGSESVAQDTLWILPAPKAAKAPVIDGKLDEWENRSAAWLFYDYSWGLLGRHENQLDDGGEHFGYPPYTVDARAALWGSWDSDNLYLAIRLEDDQPILDAQSGELVRVEIQGGGNESCRITIRPDAAGKGKAVLTAGATKARELVMRSSNTENTVRIEVAVPWKELGLTPKPNSVFGFDLYWTDVDRESGKLVSGTLHWAGASAKSGYLFLRNP